MHYQQKKLSSLCLQVRSFLK